MARHKDEITKKDEESDSLLQEKEKLQKDLRKQEEKLAAMKNQFELLSIDSERRRKDFLKEPICIKIIDNFHRVHATARNTSSLSVAFPEMDATALKDAVSKHYEDFVPILSSKTKNISEADLLLCRLCLLGLNYRQIAVILCKSYSAVKKQADRLEESMGIDEKLPEFVFRIASLVGQNNKKTAK